MLSWVLRRLKKDTDARVKKLRMKIYELFTFAVYVREFIEGYQPTLISSVQEAKSFEHKESRKLVSLVCNFFILVA